MSVPVDPAAAAGMVIVGATPLTAARATVDEELVETGTLAEVTIGVPGGGTPGAPLFEELHPATSAAAKKNASPRWTGHRLGRITSPPQSKTKARLHKRARAISILPGLSSDLRRMPGDSRS